MQLSGKRACDGISPRQNAGTCSNSSTLQYGYYEIAAMNGCSAGASKSQFHQARPNTRSAHRDGLPLRPGRPGPRFR